MATWVCHLTVETNSDKISSEKDKRKSLLIDQAFQLSFSNAYLANSHDQVSRSVRVTCLVVIPTNHFSQVTLS